MLTTFQKTALASVLGQQWLDANDADFRCLVVDEKQIEAPDVATATLPTRRDPIAAGHNIPHALIGVVVYRVEFLKGARFTVGRRDANEVVIKDRRISGSHASVEVAADGLWLTDLRSTNGTFIGSGALQPGNPAKVLLGTTFVLAELPVLFLDGAGLAAHIAASCPPSPG